jgi:hypothetical protein
MCVGVESSVIHFVNNFEFNRTVILLVMDMYMNILKDKTITVKHRGPVSGEHSFF